MVQLIYFICNLFFIINLFIEYNSILVILYYFPCTIRWIIFLILSHFCSRQTKEQRCHRFHITTHQTIAIQWYTGATRRSNDVPIATSTAIVARQWFGYARIEWSRRFLLLTTRSHGWSDTVHTVEFDSRHQPECVPAPSQTYDPILCHNQNRRGHQAIVDSGRRSGLHMEDQRWLCGKYFDTNQKTTTNRSINR